MKVSEMKKIESGKVGESKVSFLQRYVYDKNDEGKEVITDVRSPITCVPPVYKKIMEYLDNDLKSKLNLRLTCKDLYRRTVVVSKRYFFYDYSERRIGTDMDRNWISHRPFFEEVWYRELDIWGFDAFQMCWPRIERSGNVKNLKIFLSFNPIEMDRFWKYFKTREDGQKLFEPEDSPFVLNGVKKIDFDSLFEDENMDKFPVTEVFHLLREVNDSLVHLPDFESFNGKQLTGEKDLFNFFPKEKKLVIPYCDFDSVEFATYDRENGELYQFDNVETLTIYAQKDDDAQATFPLKLVTAIFSKLKVLILPGFLELLSNEKVDMNSYIEELDKCNDSESVDTIVFTYPSGNQVSLMAIVLYLKKFKNLSRVIMESDPKISKESFKMAAEELLECIKNHKREGSLIKFSSYELRDHGAARPFHEISIPEYRQTKRDNEVIGRDEGDEKRDVKKLKIDL